MHGAGGSAIDIVKRSGRRPSERFQREKLHASIVSACLSAGTPTGQAETIAHSVTAEVLGWLRTRPEVTSSDLRRIAGKQLKRHHPDASYLYEQHRMTL